MSLVLFTAVYDHPSRLKVVVIPTPYSKVGLQGAQLVGRHTLVA